LNSVRFCNKNALCTRKEEEEEEEKQHMNKKLAKNVSHHEKLREV
jgi:hypothetical protein